MIRTALLLAPLFVFAGCAGGAENGGSDSDAAGDSGEQASEGTDSDPVGHHDGGDSDGHDSDDSGGDGAESTTATVPTAGGAPPAPTADADALVEALRAHTAALGEKPELEGVVDMRVQHVLISYAGRGTAAQRPKPEAEKLAAKVWSEAAHGADFTELVELWSDDPGRPGVYAMTMGPAKGGVFQRTGMVAAFGDTGWRLEVGEIGVAPYHARKSPYGWHIVKRLE